MTSHSDPSWWPLHIVWANIGKLCFILRYNCFCLFPCYTTIVSFQLFHALAKAKSCLSLYVLDHMFEGRFVWATVPCHYSSPHIQEMAAYVKVLPGKNCRLCPSFLTSDQFQILPLKLLPNRPLSCFHNAISCSQLFIVLITQFTAVGRVSENGVTSHVESRTGPT